MMANTIQIFCTIPPLSTVWSRSARSMLVSYGHGKTRAVLMDLSKSDHRLGMIILSPPSWSIAPTLLRAIGRIGPRRGFPRVIHGRTLAKRVTAQVCRQADTGETSLTESPGLAAKLVSATVRKSIAALMSRSCRVWHCRHVHSRAESGIWRGACWDVGILRGLVCRVSDGRGVGHQQPVDDKGHGKSTKPCVAVQPF